MVLPLQYRDTTLTKRGWCHQWDSDRGDGDLCIRHFCRQPSVIITTIVLEVTRIPPHLWSIEIPFNTREDGPRVAYIGYHGPPVCKQWVDDKLDGHLYSDFGCHWRWLFSLLHACLRNGDNVWAQITQRTGREGRDKQSSGSQETHQPWTWYVMLACFYRAVYQDH